MNNNKGASLGILDIILIINIVLKVTNLITWSWSVVLWPLWVGLGCVAIILIVYAIIN